MREGRTAMRNPIGTPLPLSGVVLGALLIAAPWAQAAEPAKELKETKNYTLKELDEVQQSDRETSDLTGAAMSPSTATRGLAG